MVTVDSAPAVPSIDWVGPSSFLRVSVARMQVILRLRRGVHIGQMERPEGRYPLRARAGVLGPCGTRDLQELPALAGALQAQHQPALLPDQRRAGEQGVVLAHVTAGGDVEVGVRAAADERAEVAADARLLDVRAADSE